MKTFTAAAVFALLAVVNAQTSSSLPPSPTESIGCEPHEDHWHCEAPATASDLETSAEAPGVTEAAASATATEEHDHTDDEEHSGTGSLPPSPTESVGCEEHNDHWHCEGPASTTEAEADSTSEVVSGSSANAASGTTGSEPAEVTDSGAGRFYAGLGAAALAVAVAL